MPALTDCALLSLCVPPAVRVVEECGAPLLSPLHPAEGDLIATSSPRRRREFAAARRCAHQALAQVGGPAIPILRGAGDEPSWPRGFIGSITHCEDYRAAAVAMRGPVTALGIDAEPARPLNRPVAERILRESERDAIRLLRRSDEMIPWETVFFTSKEAAYKAVYGVWGVQVEFREMTTTLNPNGQICVSYDSSTGRHITLDGQWRIRGCQHGNHVGTVLAVTAEQTVHFRPMSPEGIDL